MIIFIKGRLQTLNQFADAISEGIEEDKIFLDVCAEDLAERVYEIDSLINEETYVVTFNNEGISLEANGVNYWNLKKVKLIDVIVDHSEFFMKDISDNLYERFYFTSVDSTQTKYLKRMLNGHEDAFIFCPHGGTDVGGINNIERDFDLLYVGNGINDKYIEINDEISEIWEIYGDYCEETSTPGVQEFAEWFCRKYEINYTNEQYQEFINVSLALEKKMYAKRRENLIRSLCESGLKVTIIGGGIWEDIKKEYPLNVELLGAMSASECLTYISRAKVLINDTPFSEGAHERVFNGMLNGTVVLSNETNYLKGRFDDWKEILFWNGKNYYDAIDKVHTVLNDDTLRKTIIKNAYQKAQNDKWSNRLEELLKIM